LSTQAPLHVEKPELHVTPQVLPAQIAVPFAGTGQTCPHAPQLSTSVVRVAQTVPQVALQQAVCPFAHFAGGAAAAGSVSATVAPAPPTTATPILRSASRRDSLPANIRAKRSKRGSLPSGTPILLLELTPSLSSLGDSKQIG
jgi:hypothetical protein